MSGIEIVGIVLGAAPLIISALEEYRNMGKRVDAFRRKSFHVDRMVRALKWQQQLVYGDVKIVLRNAGLELDVEADQCQNLLQRQDIKEAVNLFLGDNYCTYLDILRQYEITLHNIAKALRGVDESWTSTESLAGIIFTNHSTDKHASPGVIFTNHSTDRHSSQIWKRLKFCMCKDDLEKSIQDIDQYSRLLERIRERSQQSQQIMIQSNSASSRAAASALRKVQMHASKLYRALECSWTQSCRSSHTARLYLHTRIDGHTTSQKSLSTRNCNGTVFNMSLETCSSRQYCVCMAEVSHLSHPNVVTDGKTTAVKFAVPESLIVKHGEPLIVNKKMSVENICRLVNAGQKQLLKLYLHNDELQYQHTLRSASGVLKTHIDCKTVMSLLDVLQDPKHKRALNLKARVRLAALLASTALQLHATPWVEKMRSDSFMFMEDSDGKLDLENPFVICSVGESRSQTKSPIQAQSELVDLGILILELWHKESIESFSQDLGLSLEDTFDGRQSVARRWIAETQDEMVTSVYEAAVRCIECRFDAVNIDLMEPMLNVSIFETIVKPLWENCRG